VPQDAAAITAPAFDFASIERIVRDHGLANL
jgi:hypothetical protein